MLSLGGVLARGNDRKNVPRSSFQTCTIQVVCTTCSESAPLIDKILKRKGSSSPRKAWSFVGVAAEDEEAMTSEGPLGCVPNQSSA